MKVLFIGQHHRVNDPRLTHREMKALWRRHPHMEFYFLQYPHSSPGQSQSTASRSPRVTASQEEVSGVPVTRLTVEDTRPALSRFLGLLSPGRSEDIVRAVTEFFGNTAVEYIQASDVRELALGVRLSQALGSKLIYDSHEDYVRQVLDYGAKSPRAYVWAATFMYIESRFVRQCDHVFCADEFLEAKYQRPHYNAKKLSLLRNFPLVDADQIPIRTYEDGETLKLVYIGGVNRFRGVIHTARYVARFNERNSPKNLTFTIFAPENDITRDLVSLYGIRHHDWLDYDVLMRRLDLYDVGVCLWLPIPKFHRNLPLKNFDYMRVGLPFLTSNFGNLQKYALRSGGGLCIDPESYEEFERAIHTMFIPERRRELGSRGFSWARETGNFAVEAQDYVAAFSEK